MKHFNLCALFPFFMLAVLCPVISSAQLFYVAADGDDSAAGTLQAPWASLAGARDNIRPLLDGDGDITVYFRGGAYTLSQTAIFGPGDSGSAGAWSIGF